MPSLGRIRLERPITIEELKLGKTRKDEKHKNSDVELTEDAEQSGFFGLNITRSDQIYDPRLAPYLLFERLNKSSGLPPGE